MIEDESATLRHISLPQNVTCNIGYDPAQQTPVLRSTTYTQALSIYNCGRILPSPPRPLPATHVAPMAHDPTPRLSPTTSIESTDSLVTPNHSDTSTFADECAVSDGILDGHNFLFKNSSEVWEEFKGVGHDPFGIPVADAGIPASPSSSLLSGIDLVEEDTAPSPLPEVTTASIRLGSRRTAVARHASSFDFPCPPILVSHQRETFGESRPICGNLPMVGHPRPTRFSRLSTEKRWSTLPSADVHPNKHRGSNELVTSRSAGTFRTRAVKRAIADPPTISSLLLAATSPSLPGDGGYGPPPAARRSRRREAPDTFASFMDMSVNEPTLSKSRVHNFLSKITGKLKPHSKRH